MKTSVILFLIFVSSIAFSTEIVTKVKCRGAFCKKESRIVESQDKSEIKMVEIITGTCLVDFIKHETYKVIESDSHSKKIILVKENKDYDLERIVTFYDRKDFNRHLRVLPCEQTDTMTLSDRLKTDKCLATSSTPSKYFCMKERLKNF